MTARPSPQGIGPRPSTPDRTVTQRDPLPAPPPPAVRPSTDVTGPRRSPAGWLRESTPATTTPTDPAGLAYQVLEQFLDEGRRDMQRWMTPIATTPPLDLSRLAGVSNLDALSRLATDAMAQLGRPSSRPPIATPASAPIVPPPNPTTRWQPVGVAAQPLPPPPRRTAAPREHDHDHDHDHTSASPQPPKATLISRRGDVSGGRIEPATQKVRPDPSWGQMAKLP